MLIEIRVRVEAKDGRLALSLIDFGFEFEAHVHLTKAALLKRHQVVRLDEMNLQVTALRVVVYPQMELSNANAVLGCVDDDRPSLPCV